MLERIVVGQMQQHLSANSLLYSEQHGFVPKRSTVTNLLRSDTIIAQHLNKMEACDVILLDFTRAFDKVCHSVLLAKLFSLGISGKLHGWLSDFLSGRSQFVTYRGVESEPMPVTSGVVQGTVVGPYLFDITINDLPQQLKSVDLLLYADDGKAIGKATTPQDCQSLQADLDAMYDWSITNQLPFCLPKCQCMHMGHNNLRQIYTLGGRPIPTVEQCTDLGVVRTSDFMYATHINALIAKASRLSGMIYKAFSTRSEQFIKKLFVVYVRPVLEYASVIWSPSTISLQQDIERVQRRFTKRLHGMRPLPYEERLAHLHLESLTERRCRADLLTVYKVLHNALDVRPHNVGLQLSTASTRAS